MPSVECICNGNKVFQRIILKFNVLFMLQIWVFETSSIALEILVVLKHEQLELISRKELFNLEQSGLALPNRGSFETPPMVFCQYVGQEIIIYDYGNRKPKTACVNYGLLTHISEVKNNLGIDTGIVKKIAGFHMQEHDDQHKLWAHALAIYGSSALAINLKTSKSRHDVPRLS